MRGQDETERTYATTSDGALPDLAGVAGVGSATRASRERLTATYYDTAELRLARSGVALRQSTGGLDDGWQLTVPTKADTRREFHAPDDGTGTPPAQLADLVGCVTGNMPLVPVATVRTDRRRHRLTGKAGVALAEVADDRVSANATGEPARRWREIEVELVGTGGIDLLDRIEARLSDVDITRATVGTAVFQVLDTGSRHREPTSGSAGAVLLDYLREQVDLVLRHDILARRDAEDAVHQLRLALRRVRTVLRVHRRLFDPTVTDPLERELRWVAKRLGPARDLEVLAQRFRASVERLPSELVLGPVAVQLTRTFAPAAAAAARAVADTLGDQRYAGALAALRALLRDPPLRGRAGKPAPTQLARGIRRALRTVRRRVEHDADPHRIRKAARRLRYALECAQPVFGMPAERTRKRVTALTGVLGDQHDTVMSGPRLRELAIAAHQAGDNGFTFGLLYGRDQRDARYLEEQVPRRWHEIDKSTRWLG